MKIVSAYRPLERAYTPAEVTEERIGNFDWIEALQMLAKSAERYDYSVTAITDRRLPFPHHAYPTKAKDLMVWILEVSLWYLSSSEFNEDTVFVSPDSLISRPLPPMEGFDLGVVVRFGEKYAERPILNSVQFWPVKSKKRLVRFYLDCLQIAESSNSPGKWGMDTIPIEQQLAPFEPGIQRRAGLKVMMLPHDFLLHSINRSDIACLEAGEKPREREQCVIDFKAARKQYMKSYFEATYED